MRLMAAGIGFLVYTVLFSFLAGSCFAEVALLPRLYEFSSSKGFLWNYFPSAGSERFDYAGSLRAYPSGEAVLLMWSLRGGAPVEVYNVYVSLGRTAGWRFELEASLPYYKTEYSHQGLTGSMRYYYIVTAVDSYGAETMVAPYAAYACPGTSEFGISEVPFAFLTREGKNENH